VKHINREKVLTDLAKVGGVVVGEAVSVLAVRLWVWHCQLVDDKQSGQCL